MAHDSAHYNALFQADAVAFMKKYSCSPAGDVGDTGDKQTKFSNDYKYHLMGNKIAWLDFQKKHKITPTSLAANPGIQTAGDTTGFIDIRGSYTQDNTKVEAYFLPWTQDGVIRLDIPATPVNQGPRFFFTAAITGCSIFIKGTPQAPTIFHAGGSTHTNTPQEGADFWRDLIESHNETNSQSQLGANVAEVNKTNYIVDKVKRTSTTMTMGTGKKATFHKNVQLGTENSRRFEKWVKKNAGNFLVEDVQSSGCVMGIRQPSGDWWFYLQESVTIKYFSITTSFFGLKKKAIEGTVKNVMRPINFTRFYPGVAHVAMQPSLSRVLKD